MPVEVDAPVSPARWRLTLLALVVTLLGGAALALILAFGDADPPRAPRLALNLRADGDLTDAGMFDGARLLAFPLDLTPPFTVEVEASNSGAAGSAWGIWLRVSNPNGSVRDLPMLVDQTGYVVSGLDASTFRHVQFMHIQPGSNRLYLPVDQANTAVFRINDEIFATVLLPGTVEAAGLALDGAAVVDWRSIKTYTAG
ncbi:MAG: hypothetical protein IT319_13505 [Anaerolineae bacterium]|nr:hypothetical protein [Anaerolineae bacterium]